MGGHVQHPTGSLRHTHLVKDPLRKLLVNNYREFPYSILDTYLIVLYKGTLFILYYYITLLLYFYIIAAILVYYIYILYIIGIITVTDIPHSSFLISCLPMKSS